MQLMSCGLATSETEYSKLKWMYAELAMENHAPKDAISKKHVEPAHKRR
jgi:hypothetical protein